MWYGRCVIWQVCHTTGHPGVSCCRLTGQKPALLDLAIWPWFERLSALTQIDNRLSLPRDRLPQLCTWQATMTRLPAVKNCAIDVDSQAVFIRSCTEKYPNYGYGLEWMSNLSLLCHSFSLTLLVGVDSLLLLTLELSSNGFTVHYFKICYNFVVLFNLMCLQKKHFYTCHDLVVLY